MVPWAEHALLEIRTPKMHLPIDCGKRIHCSAGQEIICTRNLFQEINLTQIYPTIINVDNQATIMFANNKQISKRAKHIEIKYHFVREMIKNKTIALTYCRSIDNISDIFTKPLPRIKFTNFKNQLGIRMIFISKEGMLEKSDDLDSQLISTKEPIKAADANRTISKKW